MILPIDIPSDGDYNVGAFPSWFSREDVENFDFDAALRIEDGSYPFDQIGTFRAEKLTPP